MNKGDAMPTSNSGLISYLRRPEVIRERCHQIFEKVRQGQGLHFQFDQEKMPSLAAYVLEEINRNYPEGDVPYHSRFRHFEAGGVDRVALIKSKANGSREDWGRLLFEWVVVSVLTDAGAGPDWSWKDPDSGQVYQRSEGLAVAATHWFARGGLSVVDSEPLRVDKRKLCELTEDSLAEAFQVSGKNPLGGLSGRLEILRGLGAVLPESEQGRERRLGCLWDEVLSHAGPEGIEASAVLGVILDRLSSVWPDGRRLDGENVGDIGYHPLLSCLEKGPGLVPFHKLSQWLTYSLLEVCEECGLTVRGLDNLTGLPEYRNGGLLLDLGVIRPLRPESLTQTYRPDTEFITEWRALTVAILDNLGDEIRRALGKSQEDMPLAKILQGGTWSAGRRIAKELRDGGGPPVHVESTGTIF